MASFLKFTRNYRNIINGSKVVIVNRDTGMWMRISKECFDILEEAVLKECGNDMYPEFWTHIYKLGGHHGCFSVFYRRHPFCFCLDSFAIIVINIFINSNCKFFK